MKTPIIAVLIIFALIIILGVLVTELRDVNRVQQSEINGLRLKNLMDKKAFEHALDSIRKVQEKQADSTKYYRLLKTKDQQTVTTKTESHEKIIFTNLNDSARHSKLTKFYPSYVRP